MNIYGKQPREQLQIQSFQMNSASLLRHVLKFGFTSPCLVLAKYEISMYSLLFLVPLPFFLEKQALLRLVVRDLLSLQPL